MTRKVFSLPESTSRTQTHTVTLKKLKDINSITTNTGRVSVTKVDKNEVTFQVSGGTYTRRTQTGGSYTPSDSKVVTQNAIGTERVTYYSWQQHEESGDWGWMYHSSNDTISRTTLSYNSGGYSGTLSSVGSGDRVERYYGNPGDGYPGERIEWNKVTWSYNFTGTVTRPASDTRTYRYYYVYNVTIDYEEGGFEAKIKIGGSIRESTDGWVKIGGVAREIDSIVVKVGGVLREL